MDYITIIESFGVKLSAAVVVGGILLFWMKQKLNDKADKAEVIELKKEFKNDFLLLKTEIVQTLKEKLDASYEIVSVTIDRLESVFNAQNDKMQGIINIQIKALDDHVKRLDEKRK